MFDKTLYNRLQTKMSSAINASIQALVLEEKSTQIDALKEFLTKKVDDSDEICAFIDEFTGSTSEKKVEIKPSKSSKKSDSENLKEKKTRTKSYYSHWLSERLSTYADENKGANDRKTRMAAISKEWAAYKKTSEFEKHKEEWDLKASSESDTNEAPKKKKPAKKPAKKITKKTKKNSQMTDTNVSDSDEDEILVKSTSETIPNSDNSDSEGGDQAKVEPINSDDDSDDDI